MSGTDIWEGREPEGSAGGPLIAILGVVTLLVLGAVGVIAMSVSSARDAEPASEQAEEEQPRPSRRRDETPTKSTPFFGAIYRLNTGKLETEDDWQNKVSELSAKASDGDANALWQLSALYDHRNCPFREEAAALDYLRQAANQEYGPALYDMGKRHETGDGVDKDLDLALAFYERARATGLVDGGQAVRRLKKTMGQTDSE